MFITVGMCGRDFIKFETTEGLYPLKVVKLIELNGCDDFLNQVKAFKSKYGKEIGLWEIPKGSNHTDLLIKELILKMRGEWNPPVQYDEVCHCRQISAQDIDVAIVWGAHSSSLVSTITSASTACGTCKPDVERMIVYRLSGG